MNLGPLNLKSNLTCFQCSKIYKEPVELPCGHIICLEHLKEKHVLKNNKIKCPTCNQEFQVKGNDFKPATSFQKQIDDRIFLNDSEITLKVKIEESIKIFLEMYEEYSLYKTKLDLDCHNHFQEIRFQLDLHREKLKEKIDDIYMEMIDKTKEIESALLKNLDEFSLNSFEIKSIDEELKKLEETFRNPNLLIESIREMQLKQESAIKSIQSKLNKMVQFKDEINASNEFKPNLSFGKDLFGQLNLGQYSSFDPFESKILKGKQSLELIKLCEFGPKAKFELLYRASEDGFGSKDFHSRCDGIANTLTLFKADGYIFGGFTSVSWDSSNQYKKDPKAFLFSLTNKENKPCKMKIKPNQQQNAIGCYSIYGPVFGDIAILSNSNTGCCSNLGDIYKHPRYAYGTNEARTFLTGSFQFQLSEIEVFKK